MTTQQGVRPAEWFDLHRHDEPSTPPGTVPEPASGSEDEQAERLLADAVSADEAEKSQDNVPPEIRRALKEANKEATSLRLKLKAYEDAQKTEAQKLAERADAAEKQAQAATARAVKAEVKALAAGEFADPADAAAFLDLSKYVGSDGEVDSDAIQADLSDLLERKPHLKKAPTGPRNPAPDPSQGRGGNNGPTDFRKADKAAFDAELAKFGLRPRSFS